MPFASITTINSKERVKTHGNADATQITRGNKRDKRGCAYCPLNHLEGLTKIKGKVRGRKIFVWGQSPGPKENKQGKEFIGPSGEFLWEELARVGFTRDKVDIQNVVRCMPADHLTHLWPPLKMRSPLKEEIKCCSKYNDRALEKSKARLHLIFGQIAAQVLLKKEYKKDKRIFLSDIMKGWVVVLDHPSYFIRQGYQAGGDKPVNASLKRFRDDLAKAKQLYKKNSFDRFEFLRKQDYIGITDRHAARVAKRKIEKYARKHRVVVDMEEGKVRHGKASESSKATSVALACGFAYKPGKTYVFALQHPGAPISDSDRKYNHKTVCELLENPNIKKVMHYGASDVDSARRTLGVDIKGFDYDTQLGEYFYDPNAKSYGLTAIGDRRFPDFLEYKSIEGEGGFTPDFLKFLDQKKYRDATLSQKVSLGRTKGGINLARLPWKNLVLYNGADCHLEKLVELSTQKRVNMPLMRVYIESGYVLFRMQRDRRCMPVFDYKWSEVMDELFELRLKKLKNKVIKLHKKYSNGSSYIHFDKPVKKKGKVEIKHFRKKFLPSSGEHIYHLLYDEDKMGIKYVPEDDGDNKKKGKDKPNTRANTLKRLAARYPKCLTIVEYREVSKAKGTYVDGYLKCADLNGGHLRTNWKQTGTSTGRISSGKTKDKKNDSVINFQNIHGDHLIKCLLVADMLWYKLYKYWLKHGPFNKHNWKRFRNLYIFLGFDFSQNELRQLAEESGDKNLIKMFSSGADPHVEVGHEITGWPKEKIANDDRVRKLIKNMQFGLVFGLQGPGLFSFCKAQGVKTTLKEINKFHEKYFKRFPGVKWLQKKYRDFVEKHGYVKNVFGFRRELNTEEKMEGEKKGSFWGNQAINTPIQGASHQLLSMSIAALWRYPKRYFRLLFPQLEIHDALYFRLKLKYLWENIKPGIELMTKEPVKIVEREFKLKKRVPLAAKPKAGFRLGVQVEGIGGKGLENIWDFLNAWCLENQKLQNDYKKQWQTLQK